MYALYRNGELFLQGNSEEVMTILEEKVVTWNQESSGWDHEHNFWSILCVS